LIPRLSEERQCSEHHNPQARLFLISLMEQGYGGERRKSAGQRDKFGTGEYSARGDYDAWWNQ